MMYQGGDAFQQSAHLQETLRMQRN